MAILGWCCFIAQSLRPIQPHYEYNATFNRWTICNITDTVMTEQGISCKVGADVVILNN